MSTLCIQTNNLTHFIGEILEGAKTSEMAQRKSRHTELSDSLSETKSVPSAPSDRLTTTTTTTSTDSHSQLSIATPSPLPVLSNQEFTATSNIVKEIPKPPSSPAVPPAEKSTVSTGVGPSPPREIPMQISESKPVQTSAMSSGTWSATETQTTKSSAEIQETESSTKIKTQSSGKPKMVTSTGTSPPPQSISTQVKY